MGGKKHGHFDQSIFECGASQLRQIKNPQRGPIRGTTPSTHTSPNDGELIWGRYPRVRLPCVLTAEYPLTANPSELVLTPQENQEIKEKARWLRRVVNPFVDFYIILAVGAAGSPTATEMARRHEDRQTRDHAKDL